MEYTMVHIRFLVYTIVYTIVRVLYTMVYTSLTYSCLTVYTNFGWHDMYQFFRYIALYEMVCNRVKV
jgi:hypothetical protein